MNEFDEHIDFFHDHWWKNFTNWFPSSEWGDKAKARAYLEKYWLSKDEYELLWKPIQDKIFINQEEGLPNLIFNTEFRLIINPGGALFTNNYFRKLQRCLIEMGEKYFIVIQNDFGGKLNEPFFRMKFPVDITWKELISGNYISSVIFDMNLHDFFVFGSNGEWGKYCENEYSGFDIIGFKSNYSNIFKINFKTSKVEQGEYFMSIPPIYRPYIEYV